jgi:hypothetical protein
LGTTTVPHGSDDDSLGDEIDAVLRAVRGHGSRASATYYLKWLRQFFARYVKSLQSITSATSPGGLMTLVAQDSFYKEVHLDLPSIGCARLSALGWSALRDYQFRVPVTLASINRGTRKYRTTFEAVETATIYQRL